MEFRGGKIQPRGGGSGGRPFSEPSRAGDPGTPAQSQQVANNGNNNPGQSAKGDDMSLGGTKKSKKKWLIAAVIVIVALLVGGFCSWRMMGSNGKDEGNINKNEFQAVFLTNGQVYFGKLKNVDNNYLTLTDIYYLQVQQQVQPASSTSSNSQVSLAKLGNELHGPEDFMYVARDQVLFWENLKDSGKVVQAIDAYQKTQ